MKPIEIARRLLQLDRPEEAVKAYEVAIKQGGLAPNEALEAASALVALGGDEILAFRVYVLLYNKGLFQNDILKITAEAYYPAGAESLKRRYQKNCRALAKYKNFSPRPFPAFESLPVRFFWFGRQEYVPFFMDENQFGSFVDFGKDDNTLECIEGEDGSLLATDVYNQHQLKGLHGDLCSPDNEKAKVPVYLHYTDWLSFCSYMQCLNYASLLKDDKFIFLIEEEILQSPFDFGEAY